uniref:Ig-like domain-containing protein n=1 Tax=Mesocestoides corti TaxID=53468 RepID=A0A5K3FRK0_MESCO
MKSWIRIIMTLLGCFVRLGLCLESDPFDRRTLQSTDQIKIPQPSADSREHSSHTHAGDDGVTTVYFDSGTPIRLDCSHPKSHRNIIWERTDLLYPLAVGDQIFSPDARIQVHRLSPNESQLVIVNATNHDAHKYRCRGSAQNRPTCASQTCIQEKAFERTFNVVHGKRPSASMQVSDSGGSRSNVRSKVTILGPQLAFYGMPLELICRANFSSTEAKMDPSIVLEWYHNGVRRRASRVESGGTYVSSRWVDSNLLESRLLITWTSEKDAGRWNCVERSAMIRRLQEKDLGTNDSGTGTTSRPTHSRAWTSTPPMSFDQLNLQVIAPPPLVAFATKVVTTASAGSQEPLHHSKTPKFRRYLQLAESAGGRGVRWQVTSASDNSEPLCRHLWRFQLVVFVLHGIT